MAELPKSVIDTLIAEAVGEGSEGMRRVAETILNRAAIRGLTPEQVVTQPHQYTGYFAPGPAAVKAQNDPAIRSAAEAAFKLAMQPGDPTGGADHYFAPGTISTPYWAKSMTPKGDYGGHRFYSSRPIPPGELPNVVGTMLDTTRPDVPMPRPRPAQRQAIPETKASTGSSKASLAAPAYSVTPRLANMEGGLYAYVDREMQPPQYVGGYGSPLQTPRQTRPDTAKLYAGIYPQQQAKLPPVPPSRHVGQNHFDVTLARAAEAQRPELTAALNGKALSAAQLAQIPASGGQTVGTVGTAKTASLSNPPGSMPSWGGFQSMFGPKTPPVVQVAALPGPYSPPKAQDQLAPGMPKIPATAMGIGQVYPMMPQVGVATQLSVTPSNLVTPPGWPTQRPAFGMSPPPLPIPRPAGRVVTPSAFPTASAQRPKAPTGGGLSPLFGWPTPNATRPKTPGALNVVVHAGNGGGSSSSSGGSSSSSPSSGYVHNGQQVYATPTLRYNNDTGSFETVTTYKPNK